MVAVAPPAPPLLPPPLFPTPILEAASYTAIVSSAVSLLATLLAYSSVVVNCCRRQRRLPSMLLLIALGAAPSDVARVISGVADVLPHNSTVVQWADEWQCRPSTIIGSSSTRDERNCAALAMAHVLSTSAPLWGAILALHLIGRTICCVTSRNGCGWRCVISLGRLCVGVGLPVLACAILAADRSCDASNAHHLPPWALRLCNDTHAPHFESWAALSGGVASSGAAARSGDFLPLVLYGLPFAMAVGLSLLALLFSPATCAIERVHAQQQQLAHMQMQMQFAADGGSAQPPEAMSSTRLVVARRGLEPPCASFGFLALSVPVWLLPLARAAAQLWLARPPAASEALPWLGVASSALHPLVGTLAVLCWVCGAQRAGRTAATTAERTGLVGAASLAGSATLNMEDARTGLLNARPVAACTEPPSPSRAVAAERPWPQTLS